MYNFIIKNLIIFVNFSSNVFMSVTNTQLREKEMKT